MSTMNINVYSFNDISAALSGAQEGDLFNFYLRNDIVFESAVMINRSITINLINGSGNAGVMLTLSPGGSYRHFAMPSSINNVSLTVGSDIIIDGGSTGGGLQMFGSGCSLTLEGCTIINCLNNSNGGGVLIQGSASRSRLIMNDALIANCQAGSGGAVFGSDIDAQMNGGEISGCRAGNSGGAITTIAGGQRLGSTLTINGSIISANTIIGNFGDGGGINAFDTIVMIDSAQITDNIADNYGGGIRMLVQNLNSEQNALIIRNSVLRGNRTRNTGGGVGVEGALGEFSIINSLITGNEAVSTIAGTNQGGGVYFAGGATLILTDTTITGNFAARSGGGIFANLANLIVRGATEISNNTAGLTAGGIYGFQGCNITIEEQARIINNHAYCNNDPEGITNGGGGIALLSFGFVTTLTVRDEAVISGNTSLSYGGGIWTYPIFGPEPNIVNIEGGSITDNFANYGGAISLGEIAGYTPVLTVTGGSIINNSAAIDGGAIIAKGSLVSVANCELANNLAGRDGGAIFTDQLSNVTVYATAAFSGNQAGSYIYWAITSGGDSDIHKTHIFTDHFSTFIPEQTPPAVAWSFLNAYNNYDINYQQPVKTVRVNFAYASARSTTVHTTIIDSFLGATVIIPPQDAITDINGTVWTLDPPNQPAQILQLTNPAVDYEVTFSFTPAPETAFVTVSEYYVDTHGNMIKGATQTTVEFGGNYSKTPPPVMGYTFVGHRINNGPLQAGAVNITGVSADTAVTFVYQSNLPPAITPPCCPCSKPVYCKCSCKAGLSPCCSPFCHTSTCYRNSIPEGCYPELR